MKRSLSILISKILKLKRLTEIRSTGNRERTLQLKSSRRKVRKEPQRQNKSDKIHFSTFSKKLKSNLTIKTMTLSHKPKTTMWKHLNCNTKCVTTCMRHWFQEVLSISSKSHFQRWETVVGVKDVMMELAKSRETRRRLKRLLMNRIDWNECFCPLYLLYLVWFYLSSKLYVCSWYFDFIRL